MRRLSWLRNAAPAAAIGLLLCCAPACDDSLSAPTPDASADASADADPGDAGAKDGPAPNDSLGDAVGLDVNIDECVGKADGVACGASDSICLAEQCVTSTCGDGYVDKSGGEDCEDGNIVDGDGCTQCRWDCIDNQGCDDGAICNGSESCDTGNHVCLGAALAADGTVCKQHSGAQGVCNGGVCVQAGCGNGVKDGTEQCDDGNKDNGDGCENDCTWTCQSKADCDDGNPCTGKEVCDKSDPQKPVCKAGTPTQCTSPNPGCSGSCDAASGSCVFPDVDNDGVGCDKDCNDADPAIFPGAKECADGKDNDCDASTADGKDGDCKCYVDKDSDGFAPTTSGAITALTCPAKYTSKAPSSQATKDCWDSRSDVKPTQNNYFTKSYCRFIDPVTKKCLLSSWDYNCSTTADKQYTRSYTGCRLIPLLPPLKPICTGSGWSIGVPVPGCGKSANYISCSGTKCTAKVITRTQGCR